MSADIQAESGTERHDGLEALINNVTPQECHDLPVSQFIFVFIFLHQKAPWWILKTSADR